MREKYFLEFVLPQSFDPLKKCEVSIWGDREGTGYSVEAINE
jgi:hypothetical protein